MTSGEDIMYLKARLQKAEALLLEVAAEWPEMPWDLLTRVERFVKAGRVK